MQHWRAILPCLVVLALACGPLAARAAGAPPRVPPGWAAGHALLQRFDALEARGAPAAAWAFLDSVVDAARARGDRTLLVQALVRRGGTHTFRGDLAIGDPDLRAADSLAVALRDTMGQLAALEWRSHGYSARDRFDVAVPLARRMLRLAVRAGQPSFEGWARVNLAWADLRGLRDAPAEAGYRAAIACFRRAGDVIGLHQARIGLARVLERRGRRAEERRVYLDLLADAVATGDHYSQGHALNNLGTIEFKLGDPAAAMARWRTADSLRRVVGSSTTAEDGPAFNLALALQQLRRYDEAAARFDSLAATAARARNLPDWLAARRELASTRHLQGRHEEAGAIVLDALAHADSASASMRGWLRIELASARLGEGRLDGVLAALDDFERSGDGHGDPDLPFAATRLRAEALMRLQRPADALAALDRADLGAPLAERRADDLSRAYAYRALGRPDSALAAMRRSVVAVSARREQASSFEWREAMGIESAEAAVDYAAMILATPHVGARARRERLAFEALQASGARTLLERVHSPGGPGAPVRPTTLAALQHGVLRPGEVLIDLREGWVGSLLVAVTPGQLRFVEQPRGHELAARAERFRDVVTGDDPVAADAAAAGIAQLVLAPIASLLRGSTRVLVCAGEDPLPWALLPLDGRPLVATREVVFVPSASLLAHLRAGGPPPRGRGLLAVAGAGDAEGRPLPAAEREARWLASRFPGATLRPPLATRLAAPLLAELPRYDVIHLAGHAEVSAGNPWAAGLLLGRADDPRAWLRASAVANERLAARLCVLSGCRSFGVGAPGEGALGLAAAFLAAGVRATVATLWPVEDPVGEAFTREFYARLAAGQDAGAALRGTQNAMRARPATAAPGRWAAFVLVGEPSTQVMFANTLPATPPGRPPASPAAVRGH